MTTSPDPKKTMPAPLLPAAQAPQPLLGSTAANSTGAPQPRPTTPRHMTLSIADKQQLYRCYMPFVKGGGIFIPFSDDMPANRVMPGQALLIL